MYGLPVVATTVAAEGIVDSSGPSVFAAVTDDPKAITAAMVSCLADRSVATDIGARARAWVSSEYDFDQAVARVVSLYDRLLAARR